MPHAPRPVVRARPTARLLIISQAPGRLVHETGISFNDRSGDRLRGWLDLDRDRFYDESRIAIVGMAFCYPGTDAKGGDLPPVPVCAPRWHPRILALLPDIRLTLLVGSYAMRRYLAPPRGESATVTLRRWRELPTNTIALPHPSWRNTGWLKVNPWFETELLPVLRQRVVAVLRDADQAVPGPSAGGPVLPTPDTSSFRPVLKKTKRH